MVQDSAVLIEELIKAHGAASDLDAMQLRTLGPRERGILIESACEAAAAINRSRLATGLPPVEPAPWPPSTWEFLRKHAARVRK
jgi:hypothetical protein